MVPVTLGWGVWRAEKLEDHAPTALLVDEHEVVRRGCAQILQSRGLGACYHADSTAGAYRMFLRHRPAVVVLAWPLAGCAPLELLRRVGGTMRSCPVVAYAPYARVFGVMDILRAGADGFITQSSSADVLVESVARVLRGERYVSPDIAQKLALNESLRLRDPVRVLSQREKTVFDLTVAGHEPAEIVDRLALAGKPVANYLARIQRKLGADSIADLVRIDAYRQSG